MPVCDSCKKRMIIKIVLTILNLKPIEIAKSQHVSKSFVSKYMTGEKISNELDIYLIGLIFKINVKDFVRYE